MDKQQRKREHRQARPVRVKIVFGCLLFVTVITSTAVSSAAASQSPRTRELKSACRLKSCIRHVSGSIVDLMAAPGPPLRQCVPGTGPLCTLKPVAVVNYPISISGRLLAPRRGRRCQSGVSVDVNVGYRTSPTDGYYQHMNLVTDESGNFSGVMAFGGPGTTADVTYGVGAQTDQLIKRSRGVRLVCGKVSTGYTSEPQAPLPQSGS